MRLTGWIFPYSLRVLRGECGSVTWRAGAGCPAATAMPAPSRAEAPPDPAPPRHRPRCHPHYDDVLHGTPLPRGTPPCGQSRRRGRKRRSPSRCARPPRRCGARRRPARARCTRRHGRARASAWGRAMAMELASPAESARAWGSVSARQSASAWARPWQWASARAWRSGTAWGTRQRRTRSPARAGPAPRPARERCARPIPRVSPPGPRDAGASAPRSRPGCTRPACPAWCRRRAPC